MRIFIAAVVGVLIFLQAANGFGQITKLSPDRSSPRIIGGAGFSGANGGSVSSLLSFSFPKGIHQFTIRSVYNSQSFSFSDPTPSVWDIGLLYGLAYREDHGYISVSAGLSLVGGVRPGEPIQEAGSFIVSDHIEEEFETIGIAYEIQFFFTPPYSGAGFGLYLFGNANSEEPFTGLALAIQWVF